MKNINFMNKVKKIDYNKLIADSVNFTKNKLDEILSSVNSRSIESDYAALNQQSFVGDYLNYKDYKNGIYTNEGSYGFCLYATPMTGASEQTANQLMGLMKLRWPQKSTLSFMLYSSKEIKSRLDSWEYQRINAKNPIIRKMAQTRTNFIKQGVNKPLIENEKIMVRDYRLVISVTFNGELTNDNMNEFVNFKRTFYSAMANLSFNPTEINPDMLLNLIDELYNRKQGFRDIDYKWNPHTEIRRQVTGPSTRVLLDKDAFALNDTIVRGVTIKAYPKQEALAGTMDLIGDILNNNAQVTGQFLYCTNIFFPDISSLKTQVNAKAARAIQNADSPMAKWVPDFAKKKDDWKEALNIISDGQGLCYINQSFFVFAEPGYSNFAENDLVDVFRNRGWEVAPVSFIEYPTFLACLPMQFDNEMYEVLVKLRLTRLLPQWNIINLLISIGEWPGNSFDQGMLLFGRRGQLTSLDIFKSDGNYNVAIAADSGAGKSFFMNDLIITYLGLNAKIFTIDVGRSYLKLCDVLGGQFISFGKDQKNVCLNPFTYIGYGDSEDVDDDLNMIRDVLCQAISPDVNFPISNYERIKVGQAVKKAYYHKKREACCDDVYQILISDDEQRIRDLGVQLEPYSRHGEYSRYFNGKANVEFTNQFIVLELEELNMKKGLRGVVLNLLMFRISQEMYLSPKNQYKICSIDEGWDLMRKGSTTQDFIETGYRRARKYNGSFVTITQRIQDYYANEGALACLTNSDTVLMLKQKPESIDQLKDDKKLSLTDFGLELIKSIHTRNGIYSEIYIKGNGIQTPVRLIVDPYSALVYTTDPTDFQMIEDFKNQGISTHEAIEKVLEIKQKKKMLNY